MNEEVMSACKYMYEIKSNHFNSKAKVSFIGESFEELRLERSISRGFHAIFPKTASLSPKRQFLNCWWKLHLNERKFPTPCITSWKIAEKNQHRCDTIINMMIHRESIIQRKMVSEKSSLSSVERSPWKPILTSKTSRLTHLRSKGRCRNSKSGENSDLHGVL